MYAQHIESKHNRNLANTITRESDYHSKVAIHGDTLCADTVTIVPVDKELDVLSDGTLIIRSQAWGGQYTPSIDQVVATVAERFGPRSGVIYFSGMGDDGVMGARLMSRRAGQIWIQSLSSCVSDSMPKAINLTGRVTTTGSPEQLATHLEHTLKAYSQPAAIG